MADGLFADDFSQSVEYRQTQHSIQGRLPAVSRRMAFCPIVAAPGLANCHSLRLHANADKNHFLFVTDAYPEFPGWHATCYLHVGR
ncbi:hypothetical protein F8A87_01185 [Betaproteobacteria bacterium SCN2]|nr:hypothetical protein F8A87_01185 [Betaproteobacteria bacterium SCN2]